MRKAGPDKPFHRTILADLASWGITSFARLLTAVQAEWAGIDPAARRQRIYFANHVSHGDFVLIWTVLPNLGGARPGQSPARITGARAGCVNFWAPMCSTAC